MSNNQHEMIKYFVVTYTNWTHLYFIQSLTADDIQFDQRTLNNEEVYSKFYIRSSMEYFNKLKKLTQENTDISFNIEYGDY
jgi:hypothetical protein